MTEKDKERVRETLWALTDNEAKYLYKYLQEAKNEELKWKFLDAAQNRQLATDLVKSRP